ncbi:MAG: MATE family efflux transporter [Micavibrio aeruginosavorus]|uniref:MATE family efflux transporter n=1 Tax=Micavibrio aeruginosavorus TaxID=349221 RepID=A0A2W5PX56_9BACT|nr:MAG: MATE family efflux transporter [Micavibrio aeruginosavorus]
MSNTRIDLKTGSIRSHLVRLTIPMIWGIAAIVSFQLVDTYYVSLLGTTQLAAMTFTFPVTFFVFTIIMGFGISMSSVVSRLIGEGREADVKRVTTHGLILVFSVALALAIIGYALRDVIFKAMGADEEMRPLIHEYMTIWFFGAPFMATPFVGNSAIRAAGSTKAPAVIMVSVAVLNAALAPVLVFGLLGFPRLELQGAAIATVFSNIVAMAFGLYILGARKKMLLKISDLKLPQFGDSVKRLIFIALAAGLTSSVTPIVNTVIIGFLAGYGSEAVAAYGIASRVEAFGFIILMALAVGMGPIIGQNFGARQFDRVHETLKTAIGFSVFWCIGVAAILMLFAPIIVGAFSNDPIVEYYARMSFMIIAPSYLFSALVNGWSSAFNAMGKPQMSLMMTVIKMLVLMIPAVMIGAHRGGVMGIFWAISLVNIATGLSFHFWSRATCVQSETKLALKTP